MNLIYFKKKSVQGMTPVEKNDTFESLVNQGVSISEADAKNGSPKAGDMIAINPKNPEDKWLVAKEFIEANYEKVPGDWKERLIVEQADLQEKAEKLTKALTEGLVPEDQDTIINIQLDFMREYNFILRAKINGGLESLKFSFGIALKLLERGFMVSRVGWWADKRYFVFKQIPAQIGLQIVPKMQSLPQAVKDEFIQRQEQSEEDHNLTFAEIKYLDQLAIADNKNNIKGYSPSTEDIFANDWYIVEPQKNK